MRNILGLDLTTKMNSLTCSCDWQCECISNGSTQGQSDSTTEKRKKLLKKFIPLIT